MATTTFSAPDIDCNGCATAIKKAVGAVPGVSQVEVNIDRKHVTVSHDDAASPATVTSALDKAGFPATVVPNS